MLRLNAGFSRKVGEANYGSRGASVNVELEVESNLINDPGGLSNRIRRLFDLARRSVDEELNGSGPRSPSRPVDQTSPQGSEEPPKAANDRSANGDGSDRVRYATSSQLRAIRSIARQKRLDADRLANDRFGVNGLDELTLREASSLIDELKNGQAASRKAGGR